MIEFFIPAAVRRVVVYPTPIDTRWGPRRLREACEQHLGIAVDETIGVLFHNRAQDILVLYCVDASGDQTTSKKLDRGVFLLPAPVAGQKYAVVDVSKIATLFRS